MYKNRQKTKLYNYDEIRTLFDYVGYTLLSTEYKKSWDEIIEEFKKYNFTLVFESNDYKNIYSIFKFLYFK